MSNVKKDEKQIWAPVLLKWYHTHQRDLPWRGEFPRNPYKVWVSEIMLQQTKVEAVKPYYDSWMTQFPTMQSLAAASPDDVLRQWQGLGYYSRARNLHEAVQEVVKSYGGRVPDAKKEILSLKGIGEYTAGAILSMAYGEPEVAVDGNVLRVFARLYNIAGNILSTPVKKQITALAQAQMPKAQSGPFNEALMDFGAMVCIPKSPRCDTCPLIDFCCAKQAGTEKELPLRITKKHIPTEQIAVCVLSYHGCWLVHRRPAKGLLASMWEFPNVVGSGEIGRTALQQLLSSVGLRVDMDSAPTGTIKHVFSHKIWQMTLYEGCLIDGTLQTKEDWQWLPKQAYMSVPWAGPHGKITAMVE